MTDVKSTTPTLGLVKFTRGHPVKDVELGDNMDLLDAAYQGGIRVARAKYDFDVDGGLVSTITPATNTTIPDNAIIIGGTINSTAEVTSGGSATISVGTSAGSGTASMISLTAVASYSADATLNMEATFAAPVKMTAAGSITVTVAVAALTAGTIEVNALYFVALA